MNKLTQGTQVARRQNFRARQQVSAFLANLAAGFSVVFVIGRHARPKKRGIGLLRNWHLTT